MSKSKEKNNYQYTKTGYIAYQTQKVDELLLEGKIALGKKIILELLQDYPEDYILLKEFSRVLIAEGKYEEAKLVLQKLPEEKVYKKLVALNIKLGNEEELERLYTKYFIDPYYREANSRTYQLQRLYLYSKFNPSYCPYDELGYAEKQFFNYDEEEALTHIEKIHSNNLKPGISQFYPNINIRELFYRVKEAIQQHPENAILHDNRMDRYFIYCPNCGTSKDNNSSSYIQVETLIGSPRIITMYPISLKKAYKDAIKLSEEASKKPVKVKSGLERFYARYQNATKKD